MEVDKQVRFVPSEEETVRWYYLWHSRRHGGIKIGRQWGSFGYDDYVLRPTSRRRTK